MTRLMPRLSLSALAPVAAVAALMSAAAAQPVAAQGMQMSDDERAAFRAEIRSYLLENPDVIFEAVAEFERRNAAAQADMDITLVEINADEIFHDGHSWVGGNPDGDLTLVEFMDYRCSFCARAYPHVMDFVQNDGNVRLVIKEFPILGPQSEVMSRFAIAVQHLGEPAQYEEIHGRLIGWEGDFTETSARLLADELGLDPEAVLAEMRADSVTQVLVTNRELAQRLQISGTPTFVLGTGERGEMLRGFLPADEMRGRAADMRG
ncbi:MAG: DsbA family protein [Pararhodobacter sp.]